MSYNLTCIITTINDTKQVRCQREEAPVKKIWETWYFWFGLSIVFILVVTSASSYLASSCKRKQQNLIRIRNPCNYRGGVVIATTSGPGGIIQPDIQHFNNVVGVFPSVHRTDLPIGELASPLNPPYPAVEPVTIVRGSAPPQGFRQTNAYTEIVLPPGYVDTGYFKT